MRINHNIAALNTYNKLNSATGAQSKSMEKLSSGLRINRAGDDAAGLAISEKMRGQIRGLDMASRNAQDGISMVQTAEGALNETHDILQRMRELATQAANDTNTDTDRGEIQKEINQLTSEINRIGNTTEFNTQKLLNGGSERTAVTVANPTTAVNPTGTAATSGKATAENAVDNTKSLSGITGAGTANEVTITVDSVTYTIDQTALKTLDGSQTDADVIALFENAQDGSANALSTKADVKINSDGKIEITSKSTGATSTVAMAVAGDEASDIETALGIGTEVAVDGAAASPDYNAGTPGEFTFTATVPQEGQAYFVDGQELTLNLAADADANDVAVALKSAIEGNAELNAKYAVTDPSTGTTVTLTQKVASESQEPTIEIGEAGKSGNGFSASFQIGANAGQSMTIDVRDMRATSDALKVASEDGTTVTSNSGKTASYTTATDVTNGTNNQGSFKALDVSSHDKASAAIDVINDAIQSVSAERSKLGAFQNRLEHTINNLGTSSENLTAAESRVRDVDMAKEMMNQTKNSILSQAAQAMLAQSNQMPQGVLQLLR